MEHNENQIFKLLPILFLQSDIVLSNTTTRHYASNLVANRGITSFKSNGVQSSLVSDDVIQYIYTINMSVVCAACSLLGIVTNVINISVFVRMKFKETVNIALLGLAVSDLFSVTSLLWVCICFNPLFMYSDVPILTLEIQHKTGGWTHVAFTRVTASITAYITLERCLCIAFPLKIKTLLTPRRVVGIIAAIYVVILGTLSSNYTNFKFVWKYVPSLNKTMLGMVYTGNRHLIQTMNYILNVLFMMVSFLGVIACSLILIWKLNERSKWFQSVIVEQDRTKVSRDSQVIRMVVVVAVIFIFSFTPSVMFILAMAIQPELNMGKTYQNMFNIISAICLTFHAINASVNIFVYYNMSSKYASTFRSLYCRLAKPLAKNSEM